MKEYAVGFYKSQRWVKCRNAYIKSVGYLCEDCLKKGIVNAAEEVHHKIFITEKNINDPNITLNWDNLVALCRECHKARHKGLSERRFTIDEGGKVSPRC